jgi:hypothetical protein
MPYGEIITTAGKLIWKFKILWLFGLLASCAAGGGPRYNYNFNAADFSTTRGGLPQSFQSFFMGLNQFMRETPGYFFALIFIFFCGLGLLLWLVGIFGRTGLTRGAWLADGGAEHLGFSQLTGESTASFWRVAAISLLVGLPGFAVGLIFALFFVFGIVTSFAREATGVGIVLLCLAIPLVCVLVPVFWLLGILGDLCTVATVGENRGVFDSIRRGWQIFRRNLGPIILMALIVLVAQIVFGILLGLIFAPIGIGALMGGLLAGGNFEFSLGVFLLLGLIALPISLVVSAIFHSYLGTLWTLVFRRLATVEVPLSPAPPTPVPPIAYPTTPASSL